MRSLASGTRRNTSAARLRVQQIYKTRSTEQKVKDSELGTEGILNMEGTNAKTSRAVDYCIAQFLRSYILGAEGEWKPLEGSRSLCLDQSAGDARRSYALRSLLVTAVVREGSTRLSRSLSKLLLESRVRTRRFCAFLAFALECSTLPSLVLVRVGCF